jgi:hypothetical protein
MKRADRQGTADDRRHVLTALRRAANGVFSIAVIRVEDGSAEAFAEAAARGHPQACEIVRAIGDWLRWAASTEPGKGPQCHTCRREMAGRSPGAFTAIVPFSNVTPDVAVTGICDDCAAAEADLLAAAIQAWRDFWPDLHLIEGGRA